MKLDDAKQATAILNAIVAAAGQIPAHDPALHALSRTIRDHISQLRRVLDLTARVQQGQAVARILNELEAAAPEGSKAHALTRRARVELRARGMEA